MPRLLLLVALLAAPAAAQPTVQERAFEETDSGVFIRGGGTAIDVGGHCPQGCPAGQRCQQACEPAPCAANAPPDSVCTDCAWRCE